MCVWVCVMYLFYLSPSSRQLLLVDQASMLACLQTRLQR